MKRFTQTWPLPFALPAGSRGRAGELERIGDMLSRTAVIVLFSMMAIRFGADFLSTGRVTGLLLLVSELLVVLLTVMRRSAAVVDRSMRARLLTAISVFGPPLLQPTHVAALLPQSLTVAASIVGLAIVIAGKITLGRSFGLMPANRGVVCAGIYRLVRHPIYMGYLVTHVAFLAATPSAWNVGVIVVADIALLARAVCEEKTLAQDALYRDYQQQVRWRVLPGVF
jgi:protein-S-isoprenylcysteine O-methyltransferase Ste14